MPRRHIDKPMALPRFPMGENGNLSALLAVCPNRDYNGCFGRAMIERYPSPELFSGTDSRTAANHAQRLFPKCAVEDVRTSDADPVRQLPNEDGPGESFVSSALVSIPGGQRIFPSLPNAADLRLRLREASAHATARVPPASSSSGNAHLKSLGGELRCASPARALDERLLIMIGLPTTARDPRRREAARGSWMRHPAYGRSIGACFLLSAHAPETQLGAMLAEHREYGDLLFLDAPETRWLITKPTRYSNFTKLGRGMPTFKQYAFFQHAAAMLPNVPYVGKIDDDTAPNLGLFVPLLGALRCREHVLVGAINWAAVIPNASDTGVRNDRCGFGWSPSASLTNFGTSFGLPPKSGAARGAGYFPACDGIGAVPPFPYGTGAGYIFSRAVLRWVATSAEVIRWVRNAAGPTREELQWQKFEDTSTGYWLTYAPFKIEYMNVGRWVHDMACHPNGAHKARGGGLYRPPSNATLLVHNLKNGGFHYAAELMAHGSDSYDHRSCMDDIGSVRRANRLDAKNGVGVRGQAASAKASSFLLRRGAVRSGGLAGGSKRHGGNAKRLGRGAGKQNGHGHIVAAGARGIVEVRPGLVGRSRAGNKRKRNGLSSPAHDMDAGRSEAGASSPGSAPAVSRDTASWAATTAVPPPQPFDLIAG